MEKAPQTNGVKPNWQPSTLSIHADDPLNNPYTTDVAPSMHLSTTFRYPEDPNMLVPASDAVAPTTSTPSLKHIYSRESNPNATRLETILSTLLAGPTLTYTSGLSAFHALLVHLRPQKVAIGEGYHGCHGVLKVYQKLTSCEILSLSPTDLSQLSKGDLLHIETPLNPTGTASSISFHAAAAHKNGAYLSVDSTFAPPPLQNPFNQSADYVIHSGTKYIGGHSDMLCGVLTLSPNLPDLVTRYHEIVHERTYLGATLGSIEGWLGIRSVRTLQLRVLRQSKSATEIVSWLHSLLTSADEGEEDEAAKVVKSTVAKVEHASLQTEEWLKEQMPKGFGPVFGVVMKHSSLARRLPSKLLCFHHATSLGGVESLIEWRRMSDKSVDDRLLRVSIGVEDVEDLKGDLLDGFRALAKELEEK